MQVQVQARVIQLVTHTSLPCKVVGGSRCAVRRDTVAVVIVLHLHTSSEWALVSRRVLLFMHSTLWHQPAAIYLMHLQKELIESSMQHLSASAATALLAISPRLWQVTAVRTTVLCLTCSGVSCPL